MMMESLMMLSEDQQGICLNIIHKLLVKFKPILLPASVLVRVTASRKHRIAGAVQGQHFCYLEWDDKHAWYCEPNAPITSEAEL